MFLQEPGVCMSAVEIVGEEIDTWSCHIESEQNKLIRFHSQGQNFFTKCQTPSLNTDSVFESLC